MASDSGKNWEWSWLISVVILWWLVGEPLWHSKLRYSIQYGVSYGMVEKENKPHDCDWLKSPLGNKECHFEIESTGTKTGKDTATGRPIVSFDDGATWQFNDGPTPLKPSVSVSWKKVEDE